MTNPIDSQNATYFVLVNAQGQHSLWPDFIPVPENWTIAFGGDNRESCLHFIEEQWMATQRTV